MKKWLRGKAKNSGLLSLAALECGVDTVLAAEAFGGMSALRIKSLALTKLFADRLANDGIYGLSAAVIAVWIVT